MSTLSLTIRPKQHTRPRKVVVEVDADRLERLAANFGLFNPGFIASIDRAERDYQAGRIRKIHSLAELVS